MLNVHIRTAVMPLTVMAAALLLAACTSSNQNSNSAPSSSPADRQPAAQNPALNQWALRYTGGKAGKANPSLSPITIGYVNQQNSVPSFPEATEGIDAAVAYVNNELGGADGHPVKLVTCIIQSESDGQRCGTQLQNDPNVKVVNLGVTAVGQNSVYAVLHKPIISASPSTIVDLQAKDAYAYTSGGPGIIAGLGIFTAKYLKDLKSVAVLYADNPAATESAQTFLKPLLQRLGVGHVSMVAVADDATGPTVASALQAVGAGSAQALVTFVTLPGCMAIYDGLRSLGIHPTVIATGLCFGSPFAQHLRQLGSSDPVPNGWYFASYGYSYFQPDLQSGMETYLAKIRQYGGPNVQYTGFAGFAFADLLTTVKLISEIGAGNLTSAAFEQKAKSFKSPMMLASGPMDCGYSKLFPVLCGEQVGIEQYKDGRWLPTALGANGGHAIDVAPILGH